MNSQQIGWFNALAEDRSDSADTLEKPSMRGVQRSVVDKYSDQAHFIYELLQNADDVKATFVRFRLEKNGLFFTHNGSVHFSVSDPAAEDTDSHSGSLGHINSITSIANSNKTAASIGKFGVGFKAVFQYTRTPHIYDPGICFRIDRFIVPSRLESDLSWRNPSETVFWFPFDDAAKDPEECFEEILEKLRALDRPTLFLSKLRSVSFEGGGQRGEYTKHVSETSQHGDIEVSRLTLNLNLNGEQKTDNLLTFVRNSPNGLPYHIGYALDDDERIKPIDCPAFCFFPTKEVTNLNFIVHAAFLLTDSREGIKAGVKHNQYLVDHLARLAADSLPILRDRGLITDNLFDIIPYDESEFAELDDRRTLSFQPFYTAIEDKLQSDRLMPIANGMCAAKDHSYWASDTELTELFSDEQLSDLTGTPGAHWVLRSRGKKEVRSANRALADYIDGGDARSHSFREPNLITASLDPETLIRKIGADFISRQPHEWLHLFYGYLSERVSYQEIVKQRPIFLDEAGNAVAAFDDKKRLILFLPHDEIEDYVTISKELLKIEETHEFVKKFGVERPSLRDEIYNRVLPTYENEEGLDTSPHFKKFFHYFKECKHDDIEDFISLIQDKPFIRYRTASNSTVFHGKPSDLYFATDELKAWFAPKPDTKFVLLDEYRSMVDEKDHERLGEFFRRLGVARSPRVLSTESATRPHWYLQRYQGRGHVFEDKQLDGCMELINAINAERSLTLWNLLATKGGLRNLSGRHTWSYYGRKNGAFQSREERRLKRSKWIMNEAGDFLSAEDLTIQSLSSQYDTTSLGAKHVIAFLDIGDEAKDTAHLSVEEARKIKLIDELVNSGLSEDEIRAAAAEARSKKNVSTTSPDTSSDKSSLPDSRVIRDIHERRGSVRGPKPLKEGTQQPENDDETCDTDDYTPKPVDFGKRLERAKNRQANEIDRLEHEQALHEKANTLPKYSYGWFLALLELESMAGFERSADTKTISISFAKADLDPESPRTIILREPSRYIPQSVEELSGVRVDLEFDNGQTAKLRVESFTAREFSLLGRLKDSSELDGIDIARVVQAHIEVQNPSFLLQELLNRFRGLNHDAAFDMKGNLAPNIEFLFGPPGTGKTTHLAEKVLIPLMRGSEKARVLVLTPTNKAADVLTTRVIEQMGSDTSYLNWLIRFGTVADQQIEKTGVCRDKSFDIGGLAQSVTVTTIARFGYDGFSGANGKKLYQMDWDVIVFDEASMISLAQIVYPLFRQNPQKFIVAGDPFQIEPIVTVNQWKEENIYTMVGLNTPGSFASPLTEPHQFPITNLKTQYRSIPAIGEIFSRFTYDGVLKHHRASSSQRPLNIDGLELKPLNLIKFPVSNFESIYRAKRLETGTSYQAYSALFTFEFIRWMADQIGDTGDKPLRIGVIAPYRAQANIVNKLVDSWTGKPQGVQLHVGTIHGFQGDECDAIVALFNTPPKISTDPRMFLNKQNILNVAISRARDYLILVTPDEETEGVGNLHRINTIERIIGAGDAFAEFSSHDIEELIWNNGSYLEENTFSTGHQMVNVYRKPERRYEVRSDGAAIDIQIHEEAEQIS